MIWNQILQVQRTSRHCTPDIIEKLTQEYLQWRKTVRIVDTLYEPVDERGGAIITGDDLQRSPGHSGFTFAIGVTPDSETTGLR
jgi:hypothetical protein